MPFFLAGNRAVLLSNQRFSCAVDEILRRSGRKWKAAKKFQTDILGLLYNRGFVRELKHVELFGSHVYVWFSDFDLLRSLDNQ